MASRLPAYFELERFGISAEDVVRGTLHCESTDIQAKVILMPSWGPEEFSEVAASVDETVSGIWQLHYAGQVFTLVRSGIGAPLSAEAVLALGCTQCQTVLFTGSLAGLGEDTKIGDLFLVDRSICGDGYSRYLSPRVIPDDCFLQPAEPDKALRNHIGLHASKLCGSHSIPLHHGTVYSLDCVLPEFFRLNHFANQFGCTGLEMETAAVFRAASLVQIKAAALLQVSDSPLAGKTLYAGRTNAEREHRKTVRRQVLARAVLESLVSM